INALIEHNIKGTFYVGYPILASADESITLDALLIAERIGLVVFHIPNVHEIDLTSSEHLEKLRDIQDSLFFALENNLGRHENLRKRRSLAVNVNVVSYIPNSNNTDIDRYEVIVAKKENLKTILDHCQKTDPHYIPSLNAAIQRVTTIKPPKKRSNVKKADSKGAILKIIEKEIANLDIWQKQAAVETPNGPQRVRGLAGSGKTVVLALKAAYLHSHNPEWKIAVTFHTRSLYQQFKDMIRRFTFEHSNDEPNWNKIRVLHSWGSRNQPCLYSEFASSMGLPIRDFLYGKTRYGANNAFKGVCEELLINTQNKQIANLYDAILIDEAQDLPDAFFKLIYKFLSSEKRVIWAYDELQNLSDYSVPPVELLFGKDDFGQPNVSLANTEDEAHQDITLPVCYRNTPWALTLAHALGFGIYRKDGLVQLFDDDSIWEEIGYDLIAGRFKPNSDVSLRRKANSYPKYFEELLSPEEAISCHCFNNFNEEVAWITKEIEMNRNEDELEYDDILIILPNARTSKSKANKIIQSLGTRNIPAHLAGVSSSVDEIFIQGSVSIANIYRAKGNEAPMVYIADSDYCSSGLELIKLRNSLFTAITRSKAWLRICGSGSGIIKIKEEIETLISKKFTLNFLLPDEAQREKLRIVNRDRTPGEKAKIKQAEDGLKRFIELIEDDEIDFGTLNPDLREKLERILGENEYESNSGP
ncbi:MAG: ATP-binding domain-containing protein, partial [Desulfobacteraceae bacterium]|nr:ATP-binding domain-containing protein [Desulfobacteraceae bacterium]